MDGDSSINCEKCGVEVDSEKKFCTHCGTPVSLERVKQREATPHGPNQDFQPPSRRVIHDVIISYSYQNERDKKTADAVCAALERQKIRCWIAPRDILAGTSYGEDIIEAIDESRTMVLIFSKNSNESRHVMREAERAVSKGLPIIPFRIDDALPSKHMEYFLSATHWLDALTPPLEDHIRKLVNTVQQLIGILDYEPIYVPPLVPPPETAAAIPGPPELGPPAPPPRALPLSPQPPAAPAPYAYQPPPPVPQAMVGEKPGGRNKALLIGVIGLVLAIAIAVILILVFTMGGGMSPAEYKEEVKPAHDGFMEFCEGLFDAYDNPPEDTSLSEDYTKLTSLGEDLIGEAAAAEGTVNGVKPPQEYAGLNQDLIDYYGTVSDYMGEAMGVFSYIKSWDEITVEWANTPYAISSLPDSASIPEIAGAVQKDIATFQLFIEKLAAFEVPEQCESLHEKTLSRLEEEQRIFQDMNEAIAKNDADMLLALITEWEAFDEGQLSETVTAVSDATAFLDQFQDLLDEGKSLQEQLDAIK